MTNGGSNAETYSGHETLMANGGIGVGAGVNVGVHVRTGIGVAVGVHVAPGVAVGRTADGVPQAVNNSKIILSTLWFSLFTL